MVPEIAFGRKTRVALDVGCGSGVPSFGAFLMQRNMTTLSVAPKDVHENQIQFALERGVCYGGIVCYSPRASMFGMAYFKVQILG